MVSICDHPRVDDPSATNEPRTGGHASDDADMGGDPPCWAHLFEDDWTQAGAADGDGPDGDTSTQRVPL